MNLLNPDEFLLWAGEHQIGLDERSPRSSYLVYKPYRKIGRFWTVPERVQAYPNFLVSLLDGLEPWTSCRLWFRGGRWPDQEKHEYTDPDEEVRATVLHGFGIVSRFPGAIEWGRDERNHIITLAFLQMTFGWMSDDDLFIIPNHGQTFLIVSHHDVIHAEFQRRGLVSPFVRQMASQGHHLPTDLPDPTFYRPRWMKKPRSDTDQAG